MRRFVFTSIVVGILAFALLAGFLALGPALEQRVIPGVWLWEVPVGGLPVGEVLQTAEDGLALTAPRIALLGPEEQRWTFSPADLGLSLETGATLARAYAPGHSSAKFEWVVERLRVMWDGAVVSPVLAWDKAQAETQLHALAAQLDKLPQDAGVYLEGAELYLEPGSAGYRVDVTATLQLLEPLLCQPEPVEVPLVVRYYEPGLSDEEAAQALDVARTVLAAPLQLLVANPQEGDPGPWTLSQDVLAEMLALRVTDQQAWVGLDEAALAQYLEPLQLALYRAPVDARFHFDAETGQLEPMQVSEIGRDLDIDATIARINAQVKIGQHLVPLILQDVSPRYSDAVTAEELGILEKVAVGESYFSGSSSARDRNIQIGASKFDGVVVGPGETFSFNEFLGEVTPAEGYDESYVIVGNRTVPGVGGGICQVATTAFRAAFYGGYEIVERWPHAYRVGYYELGGYGPGFDATIYSPLVDFRFVNDTASHLLIQTEVDSDQSRLRFVFYGTDDGRVVEQIGPDWGEPEPAGPPIYEYDPDMPAGEVERLESAHEGLTATLERVVETAEGETLYHDRFVSHFVPWSARYRYGPGFVPPADAQIVD